MDATHRKIELQSPADLAHLTSNLRTLALHKLNLHLPPSPDTSAPDDLRTHVEALVDAFVAQMLAGMRSNISINGLELVARGAEAEDAGMGGGMLGAASGKDTENKEVVSEVFEPFDHRLGKELGEVVRRRDALVERVSGYRRGVGAEAARRWEEDWRGEGEALERERVGMMEGAVASVDGDGGVEALKRQADVERSWERAGETLVRLGKGLPETRARLERCGDVVGYLGGKKA